jgi:pimeloyl-ACP methyl ester carboxylesterase
MLRPTLTRSAALLGQLLAPDHRPLPSLVDWYTLVARHTRSSLAPPVLPARLLARRKSVPCIVATGEHDVFLPPERLQRPAAQGLNSRLRVISGAGHLVTDEHPEHLVTLLEEILPTIAAPEHGCPPENQRYRDAFPGPVATNGGSHLECL